MSVTVDDFRQAWPDISDEFYPDARVQYWLGRAEKILGKNKRAWGELYEDGCFAYAAHKLLREKERLDANAGGTGGIEANRGVLVSRSETVGPLKFTDTFADPSGSGWSAGSGGSSENGDWKLTVPGLEFLRLSRLVGTLGGAFYVS